MGDEIKSALEIAMEKAEKLGKLTPAEQHRIELVPKGTALAARFLKGEISLEGELNKFNKEEVVFIKEGALDVFLRNIILPTQEQAKKTSKKAMDGVLVLKKEKEKQLKPVVTEIEHLFTYYEQSLRQLQLKFREKLETARGAKSVESIAGLGGRSEMEKQMALQEEWRMALSELQSQYQQALDEHKRKIQKLF